MPGDLVVFVVVDAFKDIDFSILWIDSDIESQKSYSWDKPYVWPIISDGPKSRPNGWRCGSINGTHTLTRELTTAPRCTGEVENEKAGGVLCLTRHANTESKKKGGQQSPPE